MPTNKPGYMQNYYIKNRQSLLQHMNEVIECECKAKTTRTNIARHRKCGEHLRRMKLQVQNNLSGYYI